MHGPGETIVTQELERLDFRFVARTPTLAMERGIMGSVVTAATRALQETSITHLIIALGDQLQIRPSTLRMPLRSCSVSPGEIVRLVHNGKAGHPLALPASVLPELSATPAETLRDFLRLEDTLVCDLTIGDSGVLLDVDTPADYARVSTPQVNR